MKIEDRIRILKTLTLAPQDDISCWVCGENRSHNYTFFIAKFGTQVTVCSDCAHLKREMEKENDA